MTIPVQPPKPEPTRYIVELTHHPDDLLEVHVRDVPEDRLNRFRMAKLLTRAGQSLGAFLPPESEHLWQLVQKRIAALADAADGTPEAAERAELEAASEAYERLRFRY